MKKNKIYSILAAALLFGSAPVLTSCEDTLEKPSFTADDPDFVFSTLYNAELFVQGCYRGLIHAELFYQYNAGDCVTGACEEQLGGSKYMIDNYHYDVIMPATLSTIYGESYGRISSCNTAIDRLSKFPDSPKRNQLLAEVYTIRAFAYYNLIRIYGDVPAMFQPIESMDPNAYETFHPKRTSRDEIYDRIIADVKDHLNDLPWFSECDYGSAPERLTRQGALAVLARICLNAAGYSLRWDLETMDAGSMKMARRDDEARVRELYEIADDALNQIIQKNENKLVQASGDMSGFQYLFYNYCQRNFGISSQEMLWQLACYGASTNSNFGLYNGQPGSTGGVYGARKALQFKLPTYYLSFDPADTRRDVTCANYTVTFVKDKTGTDWANMAMGYNAIMGGKFRIQWCIEPQEAAKRNLDIPIVRYADVLLMYAETQNYLHNGPTTEGKAALQAVRDRAGISDMVIPSGQEEFQAALVQERMWEFADEFLIRNDLIRTDYLDKTIRQTQQDMKDLSAREGKYADISVYRLVKFSPNSQSYGDTFLSVPYIDLTEEEAELIKKAPTNATTNRTYKANVQKILQDHGITDGSTWYSVNMFEAWNSDYNNFCRMGGGFFSPANEALQIGQSIYKTPTGKAENGGEYPEWVAGDNGLFYGYERNKTELLPFAAKSAGHPLIDNPNLSQHPGYK